MNGCFGQLPLRIIRGTGNWQTQGIKVWLKNPLCPPNGERLFQHRRPSFQGVFQFPAGFEENYPVSGNVHGGHSAGIVRPAGFALPYLESAQAPEFYHFPGCYGGGQGLNEPVRQFPRPVNFKAGPGPEDLLYIFSGEFIHAGFLLCGSFFFKGTSGNYKKHTKYLLKCI
jgi:hypothetical protein